MGWALLIKGLIRFCAPQLALRMMARVSAERSWEFQAAGAGLLGLLWPLRWLALFLDQFSELLLGRRIGVDGRRLCIAKRNRASRLAVQAA